MGVIHKNIIMAYGSVFVPSPQGSHPNTKYAHYAQDPPDVFDQLDMSESHDGDLHLFCGSGDLYAIDIDAKNGEDLSKVFLTGIKSHIEGCLIERTQSGGTHVFFRYAKPLQSINIAFATQEDGKYKPIVELKGNGVLCRLQSNGAVKISGDETNIPYLTDEKLGKIIALAEALDEKERKQDEKYEKKERVAGITSPGDDYSENVDIESVVQLFVNRGWTVVKKNRGRVLLRRPGAKSNNHDADILVPARVFKCYSSSVAEFDSSKGYSFFAVYTILEHKGDYTSSAKALYADNWGDRSTMVSTMVSTTVVAAKKTTTQRVYDEGDYDIDLSEIEGAAQEDEGNEFDKYEIRLGVPPPKASYAFNFRSRAGTSTVKQKVGIAGSLAFVAGPQKSRKTAILVAMVAAALRQSVVCGWDVKSKGSILWIDTEQPTTWAYQTMRKVCIMANKKEHPENFKCYGLRGIPSTSQRLAMIMKIVDSIPDLSLVIIDGVVDLMDDFNDSKESGKIVGSLMSITESRDWPVSVITVCHLNKGDGQVRGAIGTALQNKCDWSLKVMINDSGISTLSFHNLRGVEPIDAVDFDVVRMNIPKLTWETDPGYDYSIGYDIPMDADEDIPGPVETKVYAEVERGDDDSLNDIPF